MRLSVRLLIGIVVVSVLGLIWTSSDERDTRPERRNEYAAQPAIEPAIDPVERTPPHVGTRARATSNAGGLPARGASAARGSSSARSAAPTATTPPPVAPAAAPSGVTPASSTTRRVPRESSPAPIPVETDSQPASTADAAAPPPEKERERASGISGSVLEKGGAPAPGVPVNLRARRVFNGSAPTSPRRATTDAGGGFAFGAVADGEYEVFTEKNDRYERASTLVRAGTDAVVLVVEPASDGFIAIRGVVEKAAGGALEGVRVQAIGQANVAATTDARGAYLLRVPAGAKAEQTALQFRRAGYRDRRWTMAEGQRANDSEVIANVRLEPDAGVTVTGVVTAKNGAPVARALVQLNSAAQGRSYRAVSNADGQFSVANVEPGPGYQVWVRPQSGFKDGLLENVLVDSGTHLAVELTPIGTATLKGRMVTPDGAPVPGFTLFVNTANAAARRSTSVTSDGDGRFVVPDLPEGRVALQTRAAPAISVSGIELSAATPDVTVVVDVGANRFEGRLVMNDGEPAAGATVSLEFSGSIGGVTSQSSRQTTTDADGNFTFTQLGGGVHVVSAAVAGAGSVRLEHSISAGMEPVHITLPGRRGRQ